MPETDRVLVRRRRTDRGPLVRGWFYCLKKPDAPQKT